MIDRQARDARKRALRYLARAGVILRADEPSTIEVTDLGLSDPESVGVQILVYVNTERCCAKEIVLFPRQTCPEQRHPPVGDYPGKEETFRCRWGTVYLYVPGDPTPNPKATPPRGHGKFFTVFHEVILKPGDQYTLAPDTLHWFQAGDRGAVVSEFSTRSMDKFDVFTDPRIVRVPVRG